MNTLRWLTRVRELRAPAGPRLRESEGVGRAARRGRTRRVESERSTERGPRSGRGGRERRRRGSTAASRYAPPPTPHSGPRRRQCPAPPAPEKRPPRWDALDVVTPPRSAPGQRWPLRFGCRVRSAISLWSYIAPCPAPSFQCTVEGSK